MAISSTDSIGFGSQKVNTKKLKNSYEFHAGAFGNA